MDVLVQLILFLYGLTLIISLILGIINIVISLKYHREENQYNSISFLGICISLIILNPTVYPGSRSLFVTILGICLFVICILLLGYNYYVFKKRKN